MEKFANGGKFVFGYQEGPYIVLRSHASTKDDGSAVVYELRDPGLERHYISVFARNAKSECVLDKLFLYQSNNDCHYDFDRLIGPDNVKQSELLASSYIDFHGVEIMRDGSITMY